MSTRLPKVVRIGPELYRPVVFLERTKNADGTPGLVELIRDDDAVSLQREDAPKFHILYGLQRVFGPPPADPKRRRRRT